MLQTIRRDDSCRLLQCSGMRVSEKSGNRGYGPSAQARVCKRKATLPEKGSFQVGSSAMDERGIWVRGLEVSLHDRRSPAELRSANLSQPHFSDVLIVPKLVFNLVPTP